jgi:predicted house-cleaning noncanonical NTP pyrophosphatase (MazG superfamily)
MSRQSVNRIIDILELLANSSNDELAEHFDSVKNLVVNFLNEFTDEITPKLKKEIQDSVSNKDNNGLAGLFGSVVCISAIGLVLD